MKPKKHKDKIKPKYLGRVTSEGNFYGGYIGNGRDKFYQEGRNIDGKIIDPKGENKSCLLWIVSIPIILFFTLILIFVVLYVINNGRDPWWVQMLAILSPFFCYLLLLPVTIHAIRIFKESKTQLEKQK